VCRAARRRGEGSARAHLLYKKASFFCCSFEGLLRYRPAPSSYGVKRKVSECSPSRSCTFAHVRASAGLSRLRWSLLPAPARATSACAFNMSIYRKEDLCVDWTACLGSASWDFVPGAYGGKPDTLQKKFRELKSNLWETSAQMATCC